MGKKLFCIGFTEEEPSIFDLPHRLCSFTFIENSENILAAFDKGVAIFNPETLNMAWKYKADFKGKPLRLNDGRVDRQGRFWFGAMLEGPSELKAELYRMSPDFDVSTHETDIDISNSLCWSPSGTTMYFADSSKNEIYEYAFNPEKGEISGKRLFAKTQSGVHPDGSCVDRAGNLWNAQWGSGQIVCYSPKGEVLTAVDIPCKQPSCVAFGGPKLDRLIVSSARIGLSQMDLTANPRSGDLFIYKTNIAGLAEYKFLDIGLYH